MTDPTIHELKTWPVYFDAVRRGEKVFEVRRNDRAFQRGDIVRLLRTREDRTYEVEYDYRGDPAFVIERRIGWFLQGGQLGIEPGFCVFSLEEIDN